MDDEFERVQEMSRVGRENDALTTYPQNSTTRNMAIGQIIRSGRRILPCLFRNFEMLLFWMESWRVRELEDWRVRDLES